MRLDLVGPGSDDLVTLRNHRRCKVARLFSFLVAVLAAEVFVSLLLLLWRNKTRAAWVARIILGLRSGPYVKEGREKERRP